MTRVRALEDVYSVLTTFSKTLQSTKALPWERQAGHEDAASLLERMRIALVAQFKKSPSASKLLNVSEKEDATVKLVETNFPGIKGIAFLDDFLFVARQPSELIAVACYFSQAGINVNFEKLVLSPVSRLMHLGVDVDLGRAAARVKPGVLDGVSSAVARCSAAWPVIWRQRLAGYVNFFETLFEAAFGGCRCDFGRRC